MCSSAPSAPVSATIIASLATLGSEIVICARSASSVKHTSRAGVLRTSDVFFLYAKPSMASFLPETVLNMAETICIAKRFFCHSFILRTWCQ
eukprot:jgi/Chrpa1/27528/Chrysochromulina_OHIO_Genome00001543-RA